VGTTPLSAPLSLSAGSHRVVLRNPEFPEYAVDVDVGAGAAERLAVSLWSLVGRLSLEVSPWAEVSVDGRAVGTTPLRRAIVLSPGGHTIRLSHPTLGVREEELTIGAGESRTLRVRMGGDNS
jgi:serine/threonine-protein kinase